MDVSTFLDDWVDFFKSKYESETTNEERYESLQAIYDIIIGKDIKVNRDNYESCEKEILEILANQTRENLKKYKLGGI